MHTLRIYRYDPDRDARPRMQTVELEVHAEDRMLLDVLIRLKALDPTLSFRRSCREGVCGSDAMNVNGKNRLACLTNMRSLPETVVLKPLPGLPVVRDLPPIERDELDGLSECILCACCSSACPSFWWNPDKYVGPAGLLQAYRFLVDSRDQATGERLDNLEDPYRLFRCRSILNCTDVCPKGLNPAHAISQIRGMLARRAL